VFVEPSPRGGLWIGGEGPLMRVEMAPSQDDWQVLETIDGLVADTLSMPVDLIETRSGTVYLTVRIGVIELAAQARSRSLPPPKVTLVEAMADGEVQALDGEATVRLAEPNSRLQLRVAMHSYRSRRDLVVRTRLDGGAWSPPTDARTLRWEELESGVRTLAVQASRGGQEWGPATTLSVHVPLPWFGRWQVWALTLVALVLVFFLIWRARTQAALREERMRSRVAMDLHDEVGGELGALRLLMGLLGRDLPADQREQVSTRAGRSLASMTASVRGIVWSLQPSRRDLQGLADHLSERARTALPHLGDALHIHVDLPNDPVLLTLEAVRGVRLLVREALHNIAKHSQARTVWLEVGAADRGRWRVQVRDDGVGFSIDERGRAGAGLTSMRARAAEIGAEIDVRSDSSGTVIELVIRGR
ncbi:MAG: ATP-binding protein, partial [Myxococcota bacterium]